MYIFCLHIKVLRRQILSLNRKCVSKMLYLASFCLYLYPYGRVNCALSYYSDIGRKGFFVPIFYKMIACVYILLTHKSVEAANFKP